MSINISGLLVKHDIMTSLCPLLRLHLHLRYKNIFAYVWFVICLCVCNMSYINKSRLYNWVINRDFHFSQQKKRSLNGSRCCTWGGGPSYCRSSCWSRIGSLEIWVQRTSLTAWRSKGMRSSLLQIPAAGNGMSCSTKDVNKSREWWRWNGKNNGEHQPFFSEVQHIGIWETVQRT